MFLVKLLKGYYVPPSVHMCKYVHELSQVVHNSILCCKSTQEVETSSFCTKSGSMGKQGELLSQGEEKEKEDEEVAVGSHGPPWAFHPSLEKFLFDS